MNFSVVLCSVDIQYSHATGRHSVDWFHERESGL